jgi:hypothetical protein
MLTVWALRDPSPVSGELSLRDLLTPAARAAIDDPAVLARWQATARLTAWRGQGGDGTLFLQVSDDTAIVVLITGVAVPGEWAPWPDANGVSINAAVPPWVLPTLIANRGAALVHMRREPGGPWLVAALVVPRTRDALARSLGMPVTEVN